MTTDNAPQKASAASRRQTVSYTDISFDKYDDVLATVTDLRRDESRIVRFSRDGLAEDLTRDFTNHFDSKPKRSPVDNTLAFLSDRQNPGVRELFLHKPGAVEPIWALHVWGEIVDFAWHPGGKRITFLTGVHDLHSWEQIDLAFGKDPSAEQQLAIERTLDLARRYYGTGRQLFVMDLDNYETLYHQTEINAFSTFEFGPVQDGVIAIGGDEDDGERKKSKLYDVNFMNDQSTLLYEPVNQLCGLQINPNCSHFACLDGSSDERGFFKGDLVIGRIGDGSAFRQKAADNIVFSSIAWRDTKSLVFTGWRGSDKIWGAASRDGRVLWWQDGEEFVEQPLGVSQIIVSPSGGTYAAIRQSPRSFPEICVLSGPYDWREISHMNMRVG